ncbi:hypothetical protein HPB47_020855, partial [Ixodes persulcatus]
MRYMRYLAIVHPLVSRVQQSKARAKRILLGVWAGPCLLAAPFCTRPRQSPTPCGPSTGVSRGGAASSPSSRDLEVSAPQCFCNVRTTPSKLPFFADVRGYYACLFLLMYLLPLAFIGWTCGRIARCLLRGISLTRQGSLRRQEANRRK